MLLITKENHTHSHHKKYILYSFHFMVVRATKSLMIAGENHGSYLSFFWLTYLVSQFHISKVESGILYSSCVLKMVN